MTKEGYKSVRISKEENYKVCINQVKYDKLQKCVSIIMMHGKNITGFPYKRISKASIAEYLIDKYLQELEARTKN